MSRSMLALAALALICAAAVPTAAADYSDIMAKMQHIGKANKTDIADVMDNMKDATKGSFVTKIIVCSTGRSAVDNSVIPGTCIITPSVVSAALTLNTVQAVCPAGFQAVGGQCAFSAPAFAQGLSTALLDPAVQGGNPAATGLITTQFCTGQILINGAAPVSGTAIGARAYCSPVKL